MKERFAALILSLSVAASGFAHGGEHHQYLGTVKVVHDDHVVITTTDKKEHTFTLTRKTSYLRANEAARKADLKKGVRVSVTVLEDGKTVSSVKISPPKSK